MPTKTQPTGKKNPKKRNGTTWTKGMPSPNPSGRPKDGESWKSVTAQIANMDRDEILQMVGKNNDLGRMLATLPTGVQMKYLVMARVFAALMFEPTQGLLTAVQDRMDGKVEEPVAVGLTLNLSPKVAEVIAKIYGTRLTDPASRTADHAG